MNLKATVCIFGLAFVLAGFQNCSQVGFSRGGDGKVLQSLVPVGGGNSGLGNVGTGTTSNDGPGVGTGTPSSGVGMGTTSCAITVHHDCGQDNSGDQHGNSEGEHDDGEHCDGEHNDGEHHSSSITVVANILHHDAANDDDDDKNCGNDDDHEGDHKGDMCGQYVACILEGPGDSVKLGMVTSGLEGVNAVSQSVCITAAECIGPVAKYFKVKGPEARGYCGHNPNVPELTNDQVDALLKNLKPLQ